MGTHFKIFCDESCHLLHDRSDIMVLGALRCSYNEVNDLNKEIKKLRHIHEYKTEIKWTKLLSKQLPFYLSLIDLFLTHEGLRFKATIVQNKRSLNHDLYNDGSHNNFYYKMAYYSLRDFLEAGSSYQIYLDYMDTLGAKKCQKLADVLQKGNQYVAGIEVQTIRSHESQLIQLCDLLIGAVAYANRKDIPKESKIKNQLIKYMESKLQRRLDVGTVPWEEKFNLFKFSPRSFGC